MYNRTQVIESIKIVKNINITVAKKNLHYAKLEEIRKLLYELMEINNHLFDPDYHYYFTEYKLAANCQATKKELDHKLYLCKYHITRELYNILNVIDNYEWDEHKQMYII